MGFNVFRAMLLGAVMLAMSSPTITGGESDGHVMGVGLVIGLPGTGDASLDPAVIESSIVGVLRRAGLDPWHGQINPGQVAKVLVTAQLPPDAADGQRVPVTVTAIGDATSLAGGILLVTPLRGPDGRVYALGKGRVEAGNQVGGASPSERPDIALRVGSLAEGAVVGIARSRATEFD
jgi:flagellar P-ring protein precursor FlgI